MFANNRMARWLREQRSSARLGFLLQIGCRVLMAVFSLLWTPLLLNSMGKALNGVFLSFQSIATLGGLGDLGMGGLVNIQTSRLLGRGDEKELKSFLAATRALFLVMAVAGVAVFLVAAPHLFEVLGFEGVWGVGSPATLALVGAAAALLLILNSYATNLNYGCGNILWPIVPSFIILQLGLFSHWLLARQHFPLGLQYLPYVAGTLAILVMNLWYVRFSHPALATFRPLLFDRKQFASLAAKSFWVYLSSVAVGINLVISRLLINAGFGPELVPVYQYNYRLCELALFVVNSACLVSLPKITQWLSSPDDQVRGRARQETERLNKFQTFLGCGAVLVYLALNDGFIGLWLGRDLQAPLSWQVAFACNLAVTAGGLAGFDLASRCSEHGIRLSGIAVFATALLNLGLSWVAMKQGSILGIALAAVVAQSVLTLAAGWFTSRQMKLSWWQLSVRNWLLGLSIVGLGLATRAIFSAPAALAIPAVVLTDAFALMIVARVVGITLEDLRQEKNVFKSLLKTADSR